MGVFQVYLRHWFIVTMCLVISAAYVAPGLGSKGGLIYPEITVKYGAVGIIFFISGLSLHMKDIHTAVSHTWLHIFVQGTTFIVYPLMMKMLCLFLSWFEDKDAEDSFYRGLQVVSCMPPPVSSAVILTRTCGGNEAAAIFNSVIGSFLGLFLTPLSLRLWLGISASVPVMNTTLQLASTVLVPLWIGQWCRDRGHDRNIIPSWCQMGVVSQCMLLLIIFSTFCDMFQSSMLEAVLPKVAAAICVVLCTQCLLLYGTWWTSHRWFTGWFSRGDTLAIMFCSTHKSLTLGLPILRIVVTEMSALGELALPLLVHHPLQMVLGGSLSPRLAAWARNKPRRFFTANV